MRIEQESRIQFMIGTLLSLIAHLVFAVVAIVVLEARAASATQKNVVWSVTLVGGETLGGISQVPSPDFKPDKKDLASKSGGDNISEESVESSKTEEVKAEKTLESPSVVEDPEKILAAKKAEGKKAADKKLAELKKIEEKKLAEEKKKTEEKKKLDEAEKKKQDELEAKKKLEEQKIADLEAKKKAEEEKLSQAKRAKEQRDRRLQMAVKASKERYQGESADAGGQGFGAARITNEGGMGGGQIDSLERLAYKNQLIAHIKRGWHWIRGKEVFEASVEIVILPDGFIHSAQMLISSGNSNFDDSVMRAVYKAAPVPAPPEKFYQDFRRVKVTFNSHE